MASFIAQSGRVYWLTEGGSYALTCRDVLTLLDIFDRNEAVRPWLELDEAAQAAGYPAAVTSLKAAKREAA